MGTAVKHVGNLSTNNAVQGPLILDTGVISGGQLISFPTTAGATDTFIRSNGDSTGATTWAKPSLSLLGDVLTSSLTDQDLLQYNNSTSKWNNLSRATLFTNPVVTGTITLGGHALTFPSGAGSAGYVLQTNGSGGLSWYNVSGGAATTLAALDDVKLTSLTTGQYLRYGGTDWENASPTKADVGLSNVDNLSRAQILDTPTITGAVTLNSFALTFPSSAGSSGNFLRTNGSGTLSWAAASLSGLSDATITTPTSGNFLKYNGSAWINSTPTSTDVGLGGLSKSGNLLQSTLLNVDSSVSTALTTVTIDSSAEFWIFTSTSAVAVTLPAAATYGRVKYTLYKQGTGSAVTITTTGGELISGATTSVALENQYDSIRLLSDGTGNWLTI